MRAGTLVLTFVILLAAYAASPVRTSADSRWSIHTAMSLARGHGGRLDEYAPAIASEHGYAIFYTNGHPYTMFPIGTSLLSAPFVWMAGVASLGLNEYLTKSIPAEFEGVIASLFGALAGCLFFTVMQATFRSMFVSVTATAVLCFGTSMWSVASRALWQHGPLVLMLTIAMLILVRAKQAPSRIQFLGLPLTAAFVIRPTAAIPIAVLSLYVLICYRPWLLRYACLAALVAIPWFAFNQLAFGQLLPFYYWPGRLSGGSFGVALLGNLVSPGRGLFVFSPVLVCCFPGFVLSMRERADRTLHAAFGAIMVLHWLAVSRFPHWWGGLCFGPRLMSDILPLAVYFVGFALRAAMTGQAFARALKLTVMGTLAVVSVAIHAQGALRWAPYLWSVEPDSIDQHPERLWDWYDLQFTRPFRVAAAMPDFGPLLPGLAIACKLGAAEGLRLSFGTGWRRPDCLQSGWSQPEAWGMWSDGAQASLEIALEPGSLHRRGVELVAEVRGLVSRQQTADHVDVLADGTVIARWTFTLGDAAGERRAIIPPDAIDTHAALRIAFRPVRPRSPAELGLSADVRHLGIGLSRIVLKATP